jgi:hypothetical protein
MLVRRNMLEKSASRQECFRSKPSRPQPSRTRVSRHGCAPTIGARKMLAPGSASRSSPYGYGTGPAARRWEVVRTHAPCRSSPVGHRFVVGCQYTVCCSTSCWTIWGGGHWFVVGCQYTVCCSTSCWTIWGGGHWFVVGCQYTVCCSTSCWTIYGCGVYFCCSALLSLSPTCSSRARGTSEGAAYD